MTIDMACGGILLTVLAFAPAFYYGVRSKKYEAALIKLEAVQRKKIEMLDELYTLRNFTKNTQTAISEKNALIENREERIKELERDVAWYERLQEILLSKSGARFVPARFKEGYGPVGVYFLYYKALALGQAKEHYRLAGMKSGIDAERKIRELKAKAWEDFLDVSIGTAGLWDIELNKKKENKKGK